MLYREDRGWGIGGLGDKSAIGDLERQVFELQQRVAHLEEERAKAGAARPDSGGGV
ncbi:hypothetical protein D3C80_1001960 [compost metagenome]